MQKKNSHKIIYDFNGKKIHHDFKVVFKKIKN